MAELFTKNIRIWLGGSFDPVHLGHLAIIEHIANILNQYLLTQNDQNIKVIISLLPTARNPLKPTPTENFHRLAMLEMGLQDLQKNCQALFSTIKVQIDTTEIYQTETVFTFNTFSYFRQKYAKDSLIFVLGMDSLLAFDHWYRAYELPNVCHLWVLPRKENVENKGKSVAGETVKLPKLLQQFLTQNLQDLILTNHGRIYLDEYKVMTVSSSQIRAILRDKTPVAHAKKLLLQSYLSPSVLGYILENKLYR